MRKLLLALGLLAACSATASAQCVGVGGVAAVPQTGLSCQTDYLAPTYAATSVGLVPGTAATDLACLTGSASRIIRVKQIRVSGTAGTAINYNLFLTKHVSANTGGTAATSTALPVPYPLDSTFPTVTATTTAWTANPTIADAAPGIISNASVFLPITSTGAAASGVVWYWDDGGPNLAPPVLRGIAQQICVNANGATAPSSGAVNITFMWTELAQ